MQKRQCISIEIHEDVLHLRRRNHPGSANDDQNLLQLVNQDNGEIGTVFVHVQTVCGVGEQNAFAGQAGRCYQVGKRVLKDIFTFYFTKQVI